MKLTAILLVLVVVGVRFLARGCRHGGSLEMQDQDLLERAAELQGRRRSLTGGERLYSCHAGLTSFHVDSHGRLLPCLMVTEDGHDLRTGSFREGWDGDLARFQAQVGVLLTGANAYAVVGCVEACGPCSGPAYGQG